MEGGTSPALRLSRSGPPVFVVVLLCGFLGSVLTKPKAAMLLAPEHWQLLCKYVRLRRDFLDPVVGKRALDRLLYLQLQLICLSNALYCLCSLCSYFVGIASLCYAMRKWTLAFVKTAFVLLKSICLKSILEGGILHWDPIVASCRYLSEILHGMLVPP